MSSERDREGIGCLSALGWMLALLAGGAVLAQLVAL